MVSEQILQYKNRIRKIEEELYVIQKNMEKLEKAERNTVKKCKEMTEVREQLLKNVRKAYERGSSLRAMKGFADEMERVIGGSGFESMYQSAEKVRKSIICEREECVQNRKRLLQEKEKLQYEMQMILQKEVP